MRSALRFAVLAVALGGCARCDRTAEPTVHLLARSLTDTTTLAMLEDGTVVVDSGVFVYRAPDDGPLERIGDLAAYKAFLPTDDATPLLRERARTFFGTSAEPMMIDGSAGYAFKDGAWRGATTKVAASLRIPMRRKQRDADTSTAVPPDDVKALPVLRREYYRKYGDGTFVGLVPAVNGAAPTPLVVRPGAHEEVIVPLPDADARVSCMPAPSTDGHAYLDCEYPDGSGRERRLYLLDEKTWTRLPLPSRALDAPVAIAKDGAVWMGLADPARLVVRSRGGSITRIALPNAPPAIARASYVASSSSPTTPGVPVGAGSHELEAVHDLAPTPGGAMIVLARERDPGARVVFRVTGKPVEHPATIGSEIDQLVEIRNIDPPKRWIGHCRQVFVEVPRERDAGSLDLRPATRGTFVSGRLHDRTVTGVVFSAFDAPTFEPFEIAVGLFVEQWTTNPASPPEVTCTVPVLDRVD